MTSDEFGWQSAAEALWGPDYQTPLAQVAGVSLRTIQRAAAPGGVLPAGIMAWLADTMRHVPPNLQRSYGMALRAGRLIPGEEGRAAGAWALEMALRDLRHRLP